MDKLDYLIEGLLKESLRLPGYDKPITYEEKKAYYRGLRNIRNPKPISEEYLKVQDEYLKEEVKAKGIHDEKDIPFNLDIISIWQGDITTLKCDAIVNAGNDSALGCFEPNHNCIDNIIHSYAGIQLRNECHKIMKGDYLDVGQVILTSAYNLPCNYVLHTVGPIADYPISKQDCLDLESCYYNCLELAKKQGLRTIAFPCISTGVFGFPKDEASKIAISTVCEYLKKYSYAFDHIIFNVFTDEDKKIYTRNLK